MTAPTPAQLATYEQMADSKNVPPPVRQALRHLTTEVKEIHATACALAEQANQARRLHPRDDSNPRGPWCPECRAVWPCRTYVSLGGKTS